jgi:predicted ribosomally synthesized peptide with nif11-like leader
MANQDLEKFAEKVLNDPGIRSRLAESPDENAFVTRAVEIGKENGFNVTPAEVRQRMAAATSSDAELSSKQLETISAGFFPDSFGSSYGCSFCGQQSGTSCVTTKTPT